MRKHWNNMVMNLATDTGGGGGGASGGAPSLFTASDSGGSPASKSGDAGTAPGADSKSSAGAASPPADSKGGSSTDWRASLPKELQEDATLKKFTSVDALAGAYVSAQKLIGADKIAVPGKHTTPEEFRQILHKIGLPEQAEKYEVKFTDPDLEPVSGSFKEAAFKAGVLPQQAQAMAQWLEEQRKAGLEAMDKSSKERFNQAVSTLKGEWGDAFQRKIGAANKLLVDFGGKELVEHVGKAGYSSDEKLVRLLADVGEKLYGEHKFVEGGQSTGLTPQEIDAEIGKLQASPAYLDRQHPQHKSVVAEITALFQKKYPVDKK